MYRLYKITGREQDYFFCEYVCPKLENKIDIEIPKEIISNNSINAQDVEMLHDKGLINDFLNDIIFMEGTAHTVYFVAEEIGDDLWLCTRLREKDGRLVGGLPKNIDKYKYNFFWIVYAIIYFTIMYFVAKRFISWIGPHGPN